ncbi:MAG: hypothetical protein JWO80_4382 [Bryobacterales bacterium]|nr:hypothetical protein [Bryobacterales bacterium]
MEGSGHRRGRGGLGVGWCRGDGWGFSFLIRNGSFRCRFVWRSGVFGGLFGMPVPLGPADFRRRDCAGGGSFGASAGTCGGGGFRSGRAGGARGGRRVARRPSRGGSARRFAASREIRRTGGPSGPAETSSKPIVRRIALQPRIEVPNMCPGRCWAFADVVSSGRLAHACGAHSCRWLAAARFASTKPACELP